MTFFQSKSRKTIKISERLAAIYNHQPRRKTNGATFKIDLNNPLALILTNSNNEK